MGYKSEPPCFIATGNRARTFGLGGLPPAGMRSVDLVAFAFYFFVKSLSLDHGSIDDENWETR